MFGVYLARAPTRNLTAIRSPARWRSARSATSTSRRSAAETVAIEQGLPVIAVASLADLLAFTGESAEFGAQRERLLDYRERYGSRAEA